MPEVSGEGGGGFGWLVPVKNVKICDFSLNGQRMNAIHEHACMSRRVEPPVGSSEDVG